MLYFCFMICVLYSVNYIMLAVGMAWVGGQGGAKVCGLAGFVVLVVVVIISSFCQFAVCYQLVNTVLLFIISLQCIILDHNLQI